MTAQDIRFFQTFTYVLAGLVGFTIFIYILAKLVDGNTQDVWVGGDPARIAAVEARTAPLGNVALKGGDTVTVAPTRSATLSFREEPMAPAGHGGEEDAHGGDGDASHQDDGGATMAQGESPAEEAAQAAAGTDESEGADEAAAGESAQEEVAAAAGEGEDSGDSAGGESGDDAAEGGEMVADTSGIDGSSVYTQGCNACHAIGVAGAPKLGDAAAWAPRVEQGKDVLYQHAINGYNAMPAKGGLTFLSDAQVKAAVDYMVDQL